jgi:hypothetical protein
VIIHHIQQHIHPHHQQDKYKQFLKKTLMPDHVKTENKKTSDLKIRQKQE